MDEAVKSNFLAKSQPATRRDPDLVWRAISLLRRVPVFAQGQG